MKKKCQWLIVVLFMLMELTGCGGRTGKTVVLELNARNIDCLNLKLEEKEREWELYGARLRQFCEMLDGQILLLVLEQDREIELQGGYFLDFYFAGKRLESLIIIDSCTVIYKNQVYRTRYELDFKLLKQLDFAF